MGAHAVDGYYSPNGNAWVRMKMRLSRYMLTGILVLFFKTQERGDGHMAQPDTTRTVGL